MPYTPKDWALGDSITESDLDHIEDGIYDATVTAEAHAARHEPGGADPIDNLAALDIDGALTVGTTLGVTGAATLGSTLGVTGAATLASVAVTGAATVGGSNVLTVANIDSGWLTDTSGFVNGSGWEIQSAAYRLYGKLLMLGAVAMKRTGAAITIGAKGAPSAGAAVVRVPAGYIPGAAAQGGIATGAGRHCSFYITTAGVITLASASTTENIATNDILYIAGNYLID